MIHIIVLMSCIIVLISMTVIYRVVKRDHTGKIKLKLKLFKHLYFEVIWEKFTSKK